MDALLIFIGGLGAGFVDAIVGGGGLISLPMMLAAGLSPQEALGTNKIIGSSSALTSSIRYGLSGLVDWKMISRLIFLSFLFGALGAYVTTRLPASFLRPMIIVGLISVVFIFIKKDSFGIIPQKPSKNSSAATSR